MLIVVAWMLALALWLLGYPIGVQACAFASIFALVAYGVTVAWIGASEDHARTDAGRLHSEDRDGEDWNDRVPTSAIIGMYGSGASDARDRV